MELNYVTILIATVVQFICGAAWYTALGKTWGEIHGFDKLSKEVQQEMMKKMGPLYGLQFLVTLLTSYVMMLFLASLSSEWHAFGMAGFLWLGLVLPTQISAVIFGGTESKWIVKKIAIQAGGSLLCLQAAAAVFYFL